MQAGPHKETLVSQTQLSSKNSTERQLPRLAGLWAPEEMVPDFSLGLAAHKVIANLASCSGCFPRTPSQVQHRGTASLELPSPPFSGNDLRPCIGHPFCRAQTMSLLPRPGPQASFQTAPPPAVDKTGTLQMSYSSFLPGEGPVSISTSSATWRLEQSSFVLIHRFSH